VNFVCPLPPLKVLVRKEYLYDFEKGRGELVEGIWCSVKSHRGEAFRFETYLPEYGALYDKLPSTRSCGSRSRARTCRWTCCRSGTR